MPTKRSPWLPRLLTTAAAPAVVFALGLAVGGCSSEPETAQSDDDLTTNVIPNKDAFFAEDMYFVSVKGWDARKMTPASLHDEQQTEGAELVITKTKAKSGLHCPNAEVGTNDLVYKTKAFSLRTSGNLTNGAPKSSYKLAIEDKKDRLFGMKAINLKSMWNDVSQMREALAWKIFEKAGVAAPRHTYAKFCINDRYYGLYSVIEQVDGSFSKDRFGNNDGNVYKAYWPDNDLGPATLEYRNSGNDDSGKQYFKATDVDSRTYRLSGSDKPETQTYDDLATLIRVLNGVTVPEGGDLAAKLKTPAFEAAIEKVFNVKSFLRWASANMLLGAWDNYYATPANYYLYNSGPKANPDRLMAEPYFTWVPWDYDNTFGIDFFGTKWQENDIVDWAAGTRAYYKGAMPAKLPLLQNLLTNPRYLAYYLDSIEHLNDAVFNEEWLAAQIGTENGPGLRARVQTAALLEADGPGRPAHTGRQFDNDAVFANGLSHNELNRGAFHVEGILHYVRMRHDNVKVQLQRWRQTIPKGSSGARFPAKAEAIP